MSSESSWRGWVIPIVAVVFIVGFGLFVRLMIGPTDKQELHYGTTPFVPGDSPYSVGRDSR